MCVHGSHLHVSGQVGGETGESEVKVRGNGNSMSICVHYVNVAVNKKAGKLDMMQEVNSECRHSHTFPLHRIVQNKPHLWA